MKPSEIISLIGGSLIVIAILVMAGALLGKYVDLPTIGPAEPTPTPAFTREAQPPIADDIERLSRGGFDVVDVFFAGEFTITLAIYVPGEEPSDEEYFDVNVLLADQFQIVRVIDIATETQLGNTIYVINYIYDCIRNPNAETMEAVPLVCAEADDIVGKVGRVIPDIGLRYLNE
jgi:hypothetical protein